MIHNFVGSLENRSTKSQRTKKKYLTGREPQQFHKDIKDKNDGKKLNVFARFDIVETKRIEQ